MDTVAFQPKSITGFLVSQVGYDAALAKQAILRATDPEWARNCRFEIRDVYNEKIYLSGDVVYWGEKWGSTWWQIPFTDLYRKGMYRIHVLKPDTGAAGESSRPESHELAQSDPFEVAENLVWERTVDTVAFTQFEERALQARHGAGWKDCGSDWRECGSHTFALIGLCDLLQDGFAFMDTKRQKRLGRIIRNGCRFLVALMDRAAASGLPEGAMAHELPNHGMEIPGDVASAGMALGYASRLLTDWWPQETADWLRRARLLFERFQTMAPYSDGGFSAINRGLHDDAAVPPGEFMTRDLLMALWTGVQLATSGQMDLKEALFRLAADILDRQIGPAEAEFGFRGHFREFGSLPHSEKANTHHDVGHDTGTVMAWNMRPLMDLVRRFPEHPLVPKIRLAVRAFALHFAIPACRQNPFGLLPQGVFDGEGLLDFCGPWHGTNVTYGYFASMAVRLGAFCQLPELHELAVANLQWMCGLHAGVTRESMAGCVYWRETIPEGVALSCSQILGVGRRQAGGWTSIPGTIVNGFSTNPQFTLQVPPTGSNDGPWLFTDEDWVPHAGGFLSAVAAIRSHFSVPWNL
jgi:hypothetical protein